MQAQLSRVDLSKNGVLRVWYLTANGKLALGYPRFSLPDEIRQAINLKWEECIGLALRAQAEVVKLDAQTILVKYEIGEVVYGLEMSPEDWEKTQS